MSDVGLDYGALGIALALDAAAVVVLGFGIYLRRHRRRDLVTAFACLNAGLFVVVQALTWVSAGASLALGFGLFAALSLVRLRSEELSYREVAYFFSALALAIVNGLALGRPVEAATLSAIVLFTVWAIDRRQPATPAQRTELVLDEVYAEEATLRGELERRLGAEIVAVSVEQLDYVRELTRVNVRYVPRGRPAPVAMRTPTGNGHAEVIGLGR